MVRARLFPAQGIVFVPLFLFLVASVISAAASETVLHTFKDAPSGAFPQSNLIADAAGNLYGTTQYGGAYGCGAVFTLILDSTGKWNETVLYSFTGGSDGANPLAGLVFDAAGNLYGTTGGFGNCCILTEVVYRLSPNGNGKWTLTVIYTFQGPIDGALAAYSLVFDAAGNLYGAAYAGGASNLGTVFELSPAAQGPWTETTLYNFTDGFDGAYPFGPLIFDPAGNLYGTTIVGGDSNCNNFYPPIVGCGVIFELTKNGDGTCTETTVHAFNYGDATEIARKRERKPKTDRQDAQDILRLPLKDDFPQIWVPSWENRDLRQLLWHRHRMVQARTRIMNQLQAVAINEGLRSKKRLWRESGREQLEAFRLAPWASRRREDLLKLLDGLNPTIAELTQAIEQEVEKCPAAQRLRTHPGVGPLTAPAFVLIIGQADRFQCGKQIARYLGLGAAGRFEREPATTRTYHEARELFVALPAGGSGASDGAQPPGMAQPVCPPVSFSVNS